MAATVLTNNTQAKSSNARAAAAAGQGQCTDENKGAWYG